MKNYELIETKRYITTTQFNFQTTKNTPSSEKEYINCIEIFPNKLIESRQDLHDIVEEIYPEITKRLNDDNKKIGIRLNVGDQIVKTIIKQGDDLKTIHKKFLSRYVATIELGNVFNGKKTDDTPTP